MSGQRSCPSRSWGAWELPNPRTTLAMIVTSKSVQRHRIGGTLSLAPALFKLARAISEAGDTARGDYRNRALVSLPYSQGQDRCVTDEQHGTSSRGPRPPSLSPLALSVHRASLPRFPIILDRTDGADRRPADVPGHRRLAGLRSHRFASCAGVDQPRGVRTPRDANAAGWGIRRPLGSAWQGGSEWNWTAPTCPRQP